MTSIHRKRYKNRVCSDGITSILVFLWLPLFLNAPACNDAEQLDPKLDKLGRATGPVTPRVSKPRGGAAQMGQVGHGKIYTGDILELIQVQEYTYLLVKTVDGKEIWTAIPKNEALKVGQRADVVESVVMKDFTSRVLGRTFPSIVFGVLGRKETDNTPNKKAMSMPPPRGMRPEAPTLPPGHPPVNMNKPKQ